MSDDSQRSRRAELEYALLELDVSSEALRCDPSGRSWLPAPLWELVSQDADARRALREFVELELEMFDLPQPRGRGASDALFTAKVVRALPRGERPDGMRRHVILAAAHALAIGVAYLVFWPLYQAGDLQPWVSNAQGWIDTGVARATAAGSAGILALGLLVLALVLLPSMRHGRGPREA